MWLKSEKATRAAMDAAEKNVTLIVDLIIIIVIQAYQKITINKNPPC